MTDKKGIINEILQLNEKFYKTLKTAEESLANGETVSNYTDELFRILHTIKGLSAMAEMKTLSKTMHKAEQLLNDIRKGVVNADQNVIDLLHKCRTLVNKAVEQNDIEKKDLKQIEREAKKITSENKTTETKTADYLQIIPKEIREYFTEIELNKIALNVKKGNKIILCKTSFDFEDFENKIEEIRKNLKNGEIIALIPGDFYQDGNKIDFTLLIATEKDVKKIKKIFPENSKFKQLENIEKKQKKEKEKNYAIPPILKIDWQKVNTLLGDIDDIESAKNALLKKAKELMPERDFEKLEFNISMLNKKLSTLHKNIVNLRLISLWPLFQLIENTIRTTAETLNKKIKISIKGANTKIDKPIVDSLIEPLLHLARNAVDHGIETPQERIKKGKPEYGTIKIEAYQSENSVFIEFSDDGKGIDFQTIREKAKDLNILKSFNTITNEQLLQLLFLPGFSTKNKASQISGRGIGLDSVKNTLTSIGGDIFVKTEKGKGTKFILKLPLTTAIMPLFFVEVENFVIAIPEVSITKIENFDKNKMAYLHNKTYYKCENEPVPLINLPQLLNKITVFSPLANVITVNFANTTVCVLIDRIIDHSEKPIIPFKGKLKNLPLFSSVCRFRENKVAYVLNLSQLIEFTRNKYESNIKIRTLGF